MSVDVSSYPFCDYPTGWDICRAGIEHIDPRCSYTQTNGAILCDCAAVELAWTKLRMAAGLEHGCYKTYLSERGLWPDAALGAPTIGSAVLWHCHVRTADDGQPCWCLTEHAHRKYGCDVPRAALAQPG